MWASRPEPSAGNKPPDDETPHSDIDPRAAVLAVLSAQSPERPNAGTGSDTRSVQRTIAIREVPVWGRRPMQEIGVQKTQLDSTVLRQNIALSMADILTYNTPLFVKQYGRATLSTVSFRGTAPRIRR